MAINFTVDYTFSPNTTISSSQVNTNFSTNAATWQGLEAKTKSFSNLVVDTVPTSSTDVAIKSYVDRLNSYRRPNLQYSSATVVNLETGINGTSGQAQLLFPDGTLRTDSTASHINFTITRNCALSGTSQSGLRATLSEATDTWYALYGVKVTDSSTDFVVVGDTLIPIQGNYTTLNTNFGSNGWVYLGMIRNGNSSGSTGDIVNFGMHGNMTIFSGSTSGNISAHGVLFATSAGATSLTYTYAAGTGDLQIPAHLGLVLYHGFSAGTTGGAAITISSQTPGALYVQNTDQRANARVWVPAAQGMTIACANSIAMDIFLSGFVDSVLGVGANPLL